MGVASLVLGIISIVFCWIPFLNWIALILAIVGLILGAVGINVNKKNGKPVGCAIAGLVLSIISVVAILLWVLVFAAAVAAA
ncbi:MAG: hypothetical protein J6Y54_01615 [Lentisphaeria bacterium]|jgi:hypothetical protein|nr:hypothetical protein [Lentisphaeria bacterium]